MLIQSSTFGLAKDFASAAATVIAQNQTDHYVTGFLCVCTLTLLLLRFSLLWEKVWTVHIRGVLLDDEDSYLNWRDEGVHGCHLLGRRWALTKL